MIKQIITSLVIGILLYLLIIIQTSISGFSLFDFLVVLLIVLGFNAFESPKKKMGIFIAFCAGLFIDIYASIFMFGLYAIAFMLFAAILKLLISRYVRIP